LDWRMAIRLGTFRIRLRSTRRNSSGLSKERMHGYFGNASYSRQHLAGSDIEVFIRPGSVVTGGWVRNNARDDPCQSEGWCGYPMQELFRRVAAHFSTG